MNLLKWLFKNNMEPIYNKSNESLNNRLQIKDIKVGQEIKIEHNQAIKKTCSCTVLGNDVKERKLLISINWFFAEKNMHQPEEYVIGYDSYHLANYHLLNYTAQQSKNDSQDDDDESKSLSQLQKEINECIETENFERADKLQKIVDKLVKK